MFNKLITATAFSIVFSVTPALADEHQMKEGDKTEWKQKVNKTIENTSSETADNVEKAKDTKNMVHPAHKMGESDDVEPISGDKTEWKQKSNKIIENTDVEAKENLEKAKDSANMVHPTYEMGEGHTVEDK